MDGLWKAAMYLPLWKAGGPPCQELNTAEHSLALRVEVDVPEVEQAPEQSKSPTLVLAGCFSTTTEISVWDVVEVKAVMFYCFNTGTDTDTVKELMAAEMPWVQLIVGSIDYSTDSYHLDLISRVMDFFYFFSYEVFVTCC